MTATPSDSDTQTLDCLGKACPVPVIELAKAVADLPVGATITVLSDDKGAKVDIPVWCRMKHHDLVAVHEDGGVFEFTVRRAR
jgi:TusA-related sulfurtransferase